MFHVPGFSVAFVLLTFFQSLEICAAQTSNHWKRLPDLPDKLGVAGAFAGVSGGALIVAGGANFPDKPPWEGGKKVYYDDVYVLTNGATYWLHSGKYPHPVAYGISLPTSNGAIWLSGSDSEKTFADTYEMFWNGSAVILNGRPPLREPVANACGAILEVNHPPGNRRNGYHVTNKIVVGGEASPNCTIALTNAWSDLRIPGIEFGESNSISQYWWGTIPGCPGPGRTLAVTATLESYFFVIGGVSLSAGSNGNPVRQYLRSAYILDLLNMRWLRIADLPFAIAASPSPAATVNGKIVVFGGDDAPSADPKTHKGFRDEMLEYNPALNEWSIIGHMPEPRATAPVVFWNGGYVIVSGEVRRGVRSPEVWMWTP